MQSILPVKSPRRGAENWRLLAALILLLLSNSLCAQTVTLTVREVPLKKVFSEIKKQTGYNFLYASEFLEGTRPVSFSVRGSSLQNVLDLCFANQPITYSMEDKFIVVKKIEKVKESRIERTTLEIRGRVVGERGEGIAGASVIVKGTANATATDQEGMFSLEDVDEKAVLLVSSIGFKNREVSVNGRTSIEVQLSVFVSSLDETVVIGYGVTSKRFSTGSVSKITSGQIASQPVDNPVAAIQGRAPGVFITTLNGLPGGNIKVEIRGRGSIAAGTDPLYIIDGVPYSSTPLNKDYVDFIAVNGEVSPLSSINPSDIESIEILKDADATAIYGSRGANGVVLITTKKGKAGKTKFDINISQGYSRVAELPDFLNLQEYLELRREGFKNDGITPTASNAPELLVWDTTKSTNWADYLWGNTAPRTSIQGTVSGGSGGTSFLFSGYYRREGTILKGDQYYRSGGGRSSIQHVSANKKFSLQLSSSYNLDYSNLILGTTLSDIILPPNFPLYDAAGNLNWLGNFSNPIATINQRAKATNTNFISNLVLQYTLLKDLNLKTSVGYTTNELQQVHTIPKFTVSPTNFRNYNSAAFGNNQNRAIIVEPQANYHRSFRTSNLDVLAGATYQRTLLTGNLIKAIDFSNENLLEFLGAAGDYEYSTGVHNEYKYASLFGRVTYNLKGRYIINATARRDGSSRFGPGRQFGNFGSLGLGWIFSSEPFIQRLFPFLSFGKIRASYGLTGNDRIPDYQFLSSYGTGSVYQGIGGFAPSVVGNPFYSWETNRKTEAALELGLLKDRVLMNLSYYRNRSGNQLVGFPLPWQTGFNSFQSNLPAVIQNTGVEGEVNGEIIKTKSVSLSVSFNITIPKSRLIDYPGLASSVYANRFVIGKDIDVIKGYHFLGVDPATGLASYEDVSKDGKISQPLDFVVIGKTSPDYFGGFGQQLRFKSLSLDAFFQFVKQRSRGAGMAPGNTMNQFSTVLGRWQNPGDIGKIPRASAIAGTPGSIGNANLVFSDAFFYDASYIRFKNVSISYTLPQRVTERMKMESVRFYLNGQNLFTVRRKANLNDPETLQGGIPPLKTLVAGIQLTF